MRKLSSPFGAFAVLGRAIVNVARLFSNDRDGAAHDFTSPGLIFADDVGTILANPGDDVAYVAPLTAGVAANAQIPWTQTSAAARPTLIEYEISAGNTIAAIEKDGATEELEMVIPNGITGGRVAYCSPEQGIYIDDGVTVSPGGTLDSGMEDGAGGTLNLIPALGSRFWSIIPLDGTRSNDAAILNARARALGLPGVLTAGAELLTNGDFATGDLTGWTDESAGTGTSTVNGSNQAVLTYTDNSNRGRIQQEIGAVSAGNKYLLRVEEAPTNARNVIFRARLDAVQVAFGNIVVGDGAVELLVRFDQSGTFDVDFFPTGLGTGDALVKSYSVKKLTAGA